MNVYSIFSWAPTVRSTIAFWSFSTPPPSFFLFHPSFSFFIFEMLPFLLELFSTSFSELCSRTSYQYGSNSRGHGVERVERHLEPWAPWKVFTRPPRAWFSLHAVFRRASAAHFCVTPYSRPLYFLDSNKHFWAENDTYLTLPHLTLTLTSWQNVQFQSFLFNPTGKAPPTRGRSVLKKEKKEKNNLEDSFRL